MITRNNIASVFDVITEAQISGVMQSKNDYIALTVNGYGYVYLEAVDFSDEIEEEVQSCGGLLCDKDDFLRLFKESESLNPFFFPYL